MHTLMGKSGGLCANPGGAIEPLFHLPEAGGTRRRSAPGVARRTHYAGLRRECRHHAPISEGLGGVQFSFVLPHHPRQRGTNENTSGLLWEYVS